MMTQVWNQNINEFAQRQLILKHHDNHVLELYYRDDLALCFSQTGTTPESL
jgi:hypothetical protein